jgi:hypothetical protein
MGSGTRRIAAIFLLAVFVAGAISNTASASPYSEDYYDDIDPTTQHDEPAPYEPNDSGGRRFNIFQDPIAWIINGLSAVIAAALDRIGLDPIESLVFNENKEVPTTVGDAFTDAEWNGAVMPWFRAFSSLAMLPVLIGVVVATMGVRIATNPRAMGEVGEMLLNVFIAAAILVLAPDILRFFLMVNGAIVDFIKGTLASKGLLRVGTAAAIRNTVLQDFGGSSILYALVNLNLVALTLYFNVIYVVRKVVLALMLIILPLVVWTWTSRKARVPVLTVFSEILTNSLMSMSHAILFGFFLTLLGISGQGPLSTWWAKLIVLNMIIPLSALVRKLMIGWMNFLGVDEERIAGLGVAGLAGIASLAKIAGTVASSAPRAVLGIASARTAGASSAGAAIKSLQPGQHMIEGQVMAFNKDTARIVNADRQGFDVPLSKLPLSASIGDRFSVTLGPEDPNKQTPEVINVRPAPRGITSGGGGRPSGVRHELLRVAGGIGQLLGSAATFGTPASRQVTELMGAVGYSSVNASYQTAGALRKLPAYLRNWYKNRQQ